MKNNNTVFGRVSTDLPELGEARVWLREIRKGFAAKKEAGVGRKREKDRECRLGRRRGLQVKDKLRTAKEIRLVSAHICYWLEQRANTTGHGVKNRQTGVGMLVCY